MANAIDRMLVGGAFVFGGIITKKLGAMDRRVQAVERSALAPAQAPEPAAAPTAAAAPPAPHAMPLPTGYGLQVTGPAGEELQIPVFLPPGFELASEMLSPDFMERPDAAAATAEAAAAPAPAPASAPAPPAPQRLEAGMQVVFGNGPGYAANMDAQPAPQPSGTPSVFAQPVPRQASDRVAG